MVVVPSEQKELQDLESVDLIQGKKQSPCTWTALGLHLDPALSFWVVLLGLCDVSQ